MPPDHAAASAAAVHADPGPESPGARPAFVSLLTADPGATGRPGDPDQSFIADLNLDQVIAAVAGDREERDLISELLRERAPDPGTVCYRQEVFRDLEDQELFQAARRFAERMRQVRAHLASLPRMQSEHQREGWFLDAASIYCDAIRSLAADLRDGPISSRGMLAFRDYLTSYAASQSFLQLDSDTAARKADLARVSYQVRIKGGHVEVTRYAGEPDYSAEITAAFERFQQGAVRDYSVQYRTWPGMTHVGARILELVARLFTAEFTALTGYREQHAGFADPVIRQFDRELQFYLAYLDYTGPLRSVGLSFCYPELIEDSKEIFARDTFDLALAAKLARSGTAVVSNEFHLTGRERVIVVSGPNQGGKTTFARTFGQLHHLAGTGCPVPGSAARVFVPDHIFTHFEREEDITNLAGKLETDLLRIQQALRAATGSSIVIMNEIFTSTTVSDAKFLGEKVLAKILELDLLSVYVTFIDELASMGPAVVSMASTIVPDNPAERTYKVVRKPADGLAYALAIAQKHHVTYEQLRGRLGS
jgi:DNA mismatch repair protein MutS